MRFEPFPQKKAALPFSGPLPAGCPPHVAVPLSSPQPGAGFGSWGGSGEAPPAPQSPRGVLGSLEPGHGNQVSEPGLLRQLLGGGTSPPGQLGRGAIRFYSGDPICFLLHQINTSLTPLPTRELLFG